MTSQHMFRMHLEWEPNSSNNDSKNYKLQGVGDKPYIMGSSASAFQGDENRYNPEE
ncbi:MAG: hypothetical protein Q8K37_03220 [Alphaproteobacteria bacterium]|nr:hypothetical protein [Alphaproteobacteria bacterium]